MSTPADKVELRGDIPRELCDFVDAYSIAKNRTRMGQVIAVLQEWAAEQHRIATVVHAVSPRNPARPDLERS